MVEQIKGRDLVVVRFGADHIFRLSQNCWTRMPPGGFVQLSLRSQGNLARLVIRAPRSVPIWRC
jgi:hypothetical protein